MFSRGSEWHRWEPHIHAPGTILNNQFGTADPWGAYLTTLENATPKIEAIAVTDYYVTDTYEEFLKYKATGRLPGVTLLFPNIELRLDAAAKSGFVNIHLLISPEDVDHLSEVTRILKRLQFHDRGQAGGHCPGRPACRKVAPRNRRRSLRPRAGVRQLARRQPVALEAAAVAVPGRSEIRRRAGRRRTGHCMSAANDTGRAASSRRPGEPSAMETGDGAVAWAVLRQIGEYGEAWRRNAAAAGVSAELESGPFRIRIQTEADLEAERFEMLAWEDPLRADGPALPFWRQDGMPEGLLEAGAEPLVGLVGDRGSVEGLRLLGGELVLKIEYGGAAVQIRLGNVERFPGDGGISIRHPFGLRVPLSVRRLLDFWSVAGLPAPRNGRGRGVGFVRSTGW